MPESIFTPVAAKNGMVVTSEQLATEIGVQVLKNGGNAIDAAVTIGFIPRKTIRLLRLIIGKKHQPKQVEICFWMPKVMSIISEVNLAILPPECRVR
jgi:predicted sugar kinase